MLWEGGCCCQGSVLGLKVLGTPAGSRANNKAKAAHHAPPLSAAGGVGGGKKALLY